MNAVKSMDEEKKKGAQLMEKICRAEKAIGDEKEKVEWEWKIDRNE